MRIRTSAFSRRDWLTGAIATLSVPALGAEADWPAFRGVGGGGTADGYPLPTSWNADDAAGKLSHVKWKAAVPGLGHSSPIVLGDRVYLCSAIRKEGKAPLKIERGGAPTAAKDDDEQSWVVLCYDAATGKERWKQVARDAKPRATRHDQATHANTTLATDGKKLVAFFGSEGMFCYDLDGKLLWSRDLGVINISKYGIGWGYASSPAVYQNHIAIVCDDPANPFMAVLSLDDGKELWRVSRKGICERSWGTPYIHAGASATQVVTNGWPWVVSYDLETGKELWRIASGGDNPIPTPFTANGWIYVTNAHGGKAPVFAIRPEARGDISLTDGATSNPGVVWSAPQMGSYISTPVVYGDYLYLGTNMGVVRCLHAKTGEKMYEERLSSDAQMYASLVAADGKVFCPSLDGEVYVLKAGPKFELISRNKMGAPCFATPAISKGTIYVRTTESLVAVG
ncbi:MAG: PQQ-binding-like beta-propeller repeat protein [Bryobacteraceae bacterium]